MKPRSEIARFIEEQLNLNASNETMYDRKHRAYHYGLCELRDLMDFIYDCKPTMYANTIRSLKEIARGEELLKQIKFINNYGITKDDK